MDRRTVLRRSVAAAVVALAGCADESGEQTPRTTEPVETQDVEPTTGTTETASPTGSTDTPDPTDVSTGTATPTTTPSPTATPDADQIVEVGADGSLRFAPDSFEVEAGATVLWRWVANNHNVRPDSIPDDATWEGTPGGDGDTFDEGYTHSHTFDVPGEYEYYCGPHRSAGMTGSFTVE